MALPSDPANTAAGAGTSRPGAARVLLAEDNPMNRTIIRDFLARMGYEVAVAEHGGEAVEMAKDGAYDLILLDIQMPVMDGLEAVARIRRDQERRGGPHVPVLALTAYAGRQELQAISLADFDRVLPKPLELNEMVHAMQEMLQKRPSPGHPDPKPGGPSGPAALPPQLRQGFLADTPARLDKAHELLALEELGVLQSLAHYLVNSALAVQAPDMADTAKRLEAACLRCDPAEARRCLEALDAAVREVCGRFQAESDRTP